MNVPSLPKPPPDRFQFHLKHLLAFMFASALLAAGLRLVLQAMERLPQGWLGTWVGVLSSSLTCGAVAYVLLRGPFLIWHAFRLSRRWNAVQTHRRELANWAKTRGDKSARIMEESGDSQGERGV
jgi:hypothetical protein